MRIHWETTRPHMVFHGNVWIEISALFGPHSRNLDKHIPWEVKRGYSDMLYNNGARLHAFAIQEKVLVVEHPLSVPTILRIHDYLSNYGLMAPHIYSVGINRNTLKKCMVNMYGCAE